MIKHDRDLINLAIAAMILLFIVLMSTLNAGAQDVEFCEVKPDGSVVCCETLPDGTQRCTSSISTPFVPTSTPVPTTTLAPTATATVTVGILPYGHRVLLPIVSK